MRSVSIAGFGYYRDQLGDPSTISELRVWRQMGEGFDQFPLDVSTMPLLESLEVGALEGYPMVLPEGLLKLPNFRSLTLHGVGWTEPDPLLFSLPALTELRLTQSSLSSVPALLQVTQLSINGALDSLHAFDGLAGMTQLKSLQLSRCRHLHFPKDLALPQLTSMTLEWPDKGAPLAEQIHHIAALPSLKELELCGIPLSPIPKWLQQHPLLEDILLFEVEASLAFLLELPSLRVVQVFEKTISQAIREQLTQRGVEIIEHTNFND